MQIFVLAPEKSGATLVAKILRDAYAIPLLERHPRQKRTGWMYDALEDSLLHGILTKNYESEQDLLDEFATFLDDTEHAVGESWAVKTTALPKRLTGLLGLCREPVVIDVWRHPAAVIASYCAATEVPYQAAQAWYLARRELHDQTLAHLGCPILQVNFEDLLADPASIIPQLALLGLEPKRSDLVYPALDESMVHFNAIGQWVARSVQRKLGPWGKIAVGYRSADGPQAEFAICYQKLLAHLRPGDGVLEPAVNLPAHWAADKLVRAFLNTDADTLFLLDDDMIFEPKHLETLRESVEGQQYDMLSALATRRQDPARPITMRLLEYQPSEPMSLAGDHYAHVLEYLPGREIFDADMTGLAFTLVRRHVLEAMIGQWGPAWTYFFPFVSGQSDDAEFCGNARRLGFKIGVCLPVEIGHLGKKIYGRPDLDAWLGKVAADLEAELKEGGMSNAPAAA